MLLKIDGWRGSGKSVLWTLLEGHPDIFCSPIHDKSFEAFTMEKGNAGWIKAKDVKTLRKLLNQTNYCNFELAAWNGFYTLDFSPEDRLEIPLNFDFYEFDKLFISRLMELGHWNVELIVQILYEALYSVYQSEHKSSNPKYYATMGAPDTRRQENYAQLFPNGKCIQVKRDIEGIIATICNRRAIPADYRSVYGYSSSFSKRVNANEVEKVLAFYSTFNELEKKYPDRFMSVGFKDLVENTETTMRKVADFLDIEFNPILTVATRDGKELVCNGKKYIGKVYDDPAKLLTEREKQLINRRIRLYKIHKLDFNPFGIQLIKKAIKKIFRVSEHKNKV